MSIDNIKSMKEKMELATDLGQKVADLMNKATAEANKLLKPHGYEITANVDFRAIKKD